MKVHLLALLLVAAASAPGCASKSKVGQAVVPGVAVDARSFSDVASAAGSTLTFVQPLGSDGSACLQSCLIAARGGMSVDLAVLYRDRFGGGLAERTITYDTDADSSIASLASRSAITDATGMATVRLSASAAASGRIEVRASVGDDPGAGRLIFVVQYEPAAAPALLVRFRMVGTSHPDVAVRLFKREGAKPLGCSDVHPDAKIIAPDPGATGGPVAPQHEAVIDDLPGLSSEGEQEWTVQAVAPAAGLPLAVGCIEGVRVKVGSTEEVEVALRGLPLRFQGRYRVQTRMDIITGLPPDVRRVVETVTGMFTRPGEVLIPLVCSQARLAEEQLTDTAYRTICGALLNDDGETLSLLGGVVERVASEMLLALMREAIGVALVDTGSALSVMLESIWLDSTIDLSEEAEPADDGLRPFPSGSASEVWETGSFLWQHGRGCTIGDPSCGRVSFKLSDVYGREIKADIEASASDEDGLIIDQHAVPGLSYGPLLNFMMERKVLPLLFGDGSSDTPNIRSYEDIIYTVLGDQYCLSFVPNDCCEYFTTRVENDVPTVALPFIPGFCEVAVSVLGQVIRGLIDELSGSLTIGTHAGEPCRARDLSKDRTVDILGVDTQPCAWDASFEFPTGEFTPASTFHGQRR